MYARRNCSTTFFSCAKLFSRCGTFNVLVSLKPWRVFSFLHGLVKAKTFNECSTSLKLLLLSYNKIEFLWAQQNSFALFGWEKATELHLRNFNYTSHKISLSNISRNQICVKCHEQNWEITNLINIRIDIDHGINFFSSWLLLPKNISAKIRLFDKKHWHTPWMKYWHF